MPKDVYRSFLSALFLTAVFSTSSYGESYAVKGSIKSSGTPVRNAQVTFTDNTNSSVSYASLTDSTGTFNIGTITAVKPNPQLPADFKLEQNYPNPFNPTTTIRFDLRESSVVTLAVYDVLGQQVAEFNLGRMSAGSYSQIVNMSRFATGVYFYRIDAVGADGKSFVSLKKMLMIK